MSQKPNLIIVSLYINCCLGLAKNFKAVCQTNSLNQFVILDIHRRQEDARPTRELALCVVLDMIMPE